ncbi:MAG: division/cell wall cluster transcriptional repressor MraZ [Pararhodobacter sp.]
MAVTSGFRGSETLTIDAKGRVSIPSDFRPVIQAGDPEWKEGLRARVVIVYGGQAQDHFKFYTIETINEIEKLIQKLPRGSMQRKAADRTYFGQATTVTLLEDGRVQLTQKLREKLNLKDKAFFTGESDKFLMYNPDVFAEQEADIDAWIDEQGPEFNIEAVLDEAAASGAP